MKARYFGPLAIGMSLALASPASAQSQSMVKLSPQAAAEMRRNIPTDAQIEIAGKKLQVTKIACMSFKATLWTNRDYARLSPENKKIVESFSSIAKLLIIRANPKLHALFASVQKVITQATGRDEILTLAQRAKNNIMGKAVRAAVAQCRFMKH